MKNKMMHLSESGTPFIGDLDDFKVFAERRDWGYDVALAVIVNKNEKRYLVKFNPELVEIPEKETVFPQTTFEAGNKFFEKLANELRDIGFKGKEESTDDSLKATKFHLEDMRKLVFGDE